MQWLIDIAIEAMEDWFALYGGFHDRGDPPAVDFTLLAATLDGAWHELDLSAIVPENVKGVVLSTGLLNGGVNKSFMIRTHGNVNDDNVGRMNTQAANILCFGDLIVAPDSDKKIDYLGHAGGWLAVVLTVKGWWY